MKIKVGILDSLIETDNPDLLRALSDKWAFPINGYQYTPAYRRRGWDGKKRFISNQGKFKTGLLNDILENLKQIKCDPIIETEITSSRFLEGVVELGKQKLYDYQIDACNKALSLNRCLLKSPTGSGKTLMIASLVNMFPDEKIVILFDERSILTQTYEYLTKKCWFEDIGICMGGEYKDGRVMLCTVQSIDKILDYYIDSTKVLIVDEVHKFSKGEVAVAAIQSFPNALYRFGFTATLPDDPIALYTLKGAFGPIVETKSTKDLIEDQKLAKPIIQIIEYVDELKPEDVDDSYASLYDKFIVNSGKRNKLIIDLCWKIYYTNNKNYRVCILVKNLEHLRILKEALPNAYSLEGVNSLQERKSSIKSFLNSDKPSFLIGTKVLQTGINIEEITHLINARGLKDKIPTLQGLGRGMRKMDGKSVVMVYDFMDKIPYLEAHSKARIKHYKKEGHSIDYIKL